MPRVPWPLAASVVGSAVFVAFVVTGTYHPSGDSGADALVFLTSAPAAAVVSFFLGRLPRRVESLVGVIVLTAALEVGNLNPLPAMITIGFWLVGSVARSHRQQAGLLRARAFELEAGRDAYAFEAVRYERARIARELHDIVAHSLSVIVIQASAGQRLPSADRAAPEMLADIVGLTQEVRRDLGGLSRLLEAGSPGAPSLSQQSIDDLLARTASTGSLVSSQVSEGLDQLSARTGAIGYRVLQEGLTNAVKHAPGAPIEVAIDLADVLSVAVVNGPSASRSTGPAAPGSGRGLAGLAQRVQEAQGVVTAGPTPQAGWSVCVDLPLRSQALGRSLA